MTGKFRVIAVNSTALQNLGKEKIDRAFLLLGKEIDLEQQVNFLVDPVSKRGWFPQHVQPIDQNANVILQTMGQKIRKDSEYEFSLRITSYFLEALIRLRAKELTNVLISETIKQYVPTVCQDHISTCKDIITLEVEVEKLMVGGDSSFLRTLFAEHYSKAKLVISNCAFTE
jgi:hypothetical protein